jgi:hypothetical protein
VQVKGGGVKRNDVAIPPWQDSASLLGWRLGSARAFGRENQPFAMPVWERQIFFKKPLASGRVFDIFSAPFRPKD